MQSTLPPTPPNGNVDEPGPIIQPSNGMWRPVSKRVGIKLGTYVLWNSFYAVMEFFNRSLASNPNRKVSWDNWPPTLGLVYLIAKIRFNRSNTLTDPYDYQSLDNNPPSQHQPKSANEYIAADGQWVSDAQSGKMGASMTRYSSNIAPRKVRPDVENMTPSARDVSRRLRWRHLDENHDEVVIPALILNVAAQAWIQFQFHGFGGNTLRDPLNQNPYHLPRRPEDAWPNNEALIDRTTQDPTRVTYDGRPTPINEKVHAWVQGQLYGNNDAEQKRLRTKSGTGAKLILDEEGFLPEDPSRPGVDLTGYSNNYSPYLSFLHWLFSKEHNAIVDYFQAFHPNWDEERLFQYARKTNCAQIARIHTVEWTEDLLQHPTLQLGMHADWYGLLGQPLKCYLMRQSYRHVWLNWLLTPIRCMDVIWGAPGSKWDHYDASFQVPKHFRMVYRLHEMLLGKNDILDPRSGQLLDRIETIDFIHHHTRKQVKRFGYDTLGWSFVSQSCGALQLHNFPRALTQFKRMQDDNLIDLAELDIFREREDGTGSYNDLRRSLGEPPVASFLELTGGDAELANEIEQIYQGDINRVDAGIGILAEPKPAGFALGFVQFYQFVLNAPRRIKSNRFLSEGYNYNQYQEGLNWVEHGAGFKGAIRRHLPLLATKLEGVKHGFAPWPEMEAFPERLLSETQDDTGKAFLVDLRTVSFVLLTGTLATSSGLIPLWQAILIPLCLLVAVIAVAMTRLLARRFMELCEKRCNTDKRADMLSTLYGAETSIRWASHISRWGSWSILLCTIYGAYWAYPIHLWLSLGFVSIAVSTLSTWQWANAFTENVHLLKIALRNRMRAGQSADIQMPTLTSEEDKELSRLFRTYAPGREYLTVYDFNRMYEVERRSFFGIGNGKHWSRRILIDHADLIVEEDRKLVPAITKNTYILMIKGLAQQKLKQEKQTPGLDLNLKWM